MIVEGIVTSLPALPTSSLVAVSEEQRIEDEGGRGQGQTVSVEKTTGRGQRQEERLTETTRHSH